MALEDYVESEVAVAVAAAAALLSPRVRGLVRRGAVIGLTALFTVGDALASTGQDVARSTRLGPSTGGPGLQDIINRSAGDQGTAERPGE